jgi:hypothetical protein
MNMIQMNNNNNSGHRILKSLIAIAIIQAKIMLINIINRTCSTKDHYPIICDPQDWCLKEEN